MFNNFSILSELIVENRTLAERFLENLSSVYRYVIQHLKRDTVPVSEELDFLPLLDRDALRECHKRRCG